MQTTIQHLFQVTELEDVSRQRLEAFVEEYPYFGYGHYLLSRKLRAEEAGEFTGTTAKTSLYFSNPFWLQWLLVNAPEPVARKKDAPVAEIPVPEMQAAGPVTDGGFAEESSPEPEEKDIWSSPEMLVELEVPAEKPSTPAPEASSAETPVQLQETGSPAETADPLQEAEPSAAQQLLDSIEQSRLLRESLLKINEDFHPGILPAVEPIRDEEPPFILEEQEPATTPAAEISVPAPIEEPSAPEPPQEELLAPTPAAEPGIHTEPVTHTGHVVHAEPIVNAGQVVPAEPLVNPEPVEAAAPAATTEPALVFEPFHTIDYFASQGIKLTLDENPSDQLGKQLKSFTEWLKVMRRLPQKDKGIIPDRVAEQEVQSIAAHSIEGKEVLTETMAEVLAMQGMPERARIVYEKLSLLNPGKSAYFAAKIEQLNSH